MLYIYIKKKLVVILIIISSIYFFLCRRENFTPTCNSRVCSWHFPDGKAAGPPSRFQWNEGKTFSFPNPPPKRKSTTGPASPPSLNIAEEPTSDQEPSQIPCKKSQLELEVENSILRAENEKLKQQLDKQAFSFDQIATNPERVQYYTGLPDTPTVLFLEGLLARFDIQYHSNWTVQSMPLIDQLLLTLMKLKLNCGHVDLATRFNCSTATVTNIFVTIVSALYDILYVGFMENNIPSRAKNNTSLPTCFQPFPNCRMVLDCTEVAVSNTESLEAQSHLYS